MRVQRRGGATNDKDGARLWRASFYFWIEKRGRSAGFSGCLVGRTIADGVGCVRRFGPVVGVRQAQFGRLGFPVAEEAYDFEDISPGGECFVVHPFEGIDGEEKEHLLLGHLAFFGGACEVGAAAAWAASAFEAGIGGRPGEVAAVDACAAVDDIPRLGFRLIVLCFVGHSCSPWCADRRGRGANATIS